MKLPTQLIFVVVVVLGELIQEKKLNKLRWMKRVVRSIKKDLDIHQIMFFLIGANFNNEVVKVNRNIQKTLPTLYFNASYAKEKMKPFGNMKSFPSPRETTLFIIAESPENKSCTLRTEEVMQVIGNLSKVRIRPKCLILRFFDSDHSSVYVKFLQKMWENNFLDITILDITKENRTIHQLNPFFSYRKYPYSRKTHLFPDKLRNLNGYPIKVGVFNRPPFDQVKLNSTKHPNKITGPDALIGTIFSEVMNFKLLFALSDKQGFGKFSCNISKSNGFLHMVQNNKIQYIGVRTVIGSTLCGEQTLESVVTGLDNYVAIVPTMKSTGVSILIGSTFYYPIIVIALFTKTGWIIHSHFRFDNMIWKWTVIIQILLGVCVPQEPRNLRERIIFGCFLVLAFHYSSSIFASLTDFNFHQEEEIEINNLRDLVKSGLQFGVEPNVALAFILAFGDVDEISVLAKNGKRFLFLEDCLGFLLQHKNITCITKMSLAKWHTGLYKERNLIKFVPEIIMTSVTGFHQERGSPYREKFQEIHNLLTEFALLDKWNIRNTYYSKSVGQLEVFLESQVNNRFIRPLLMGIALIGLSASILTFFAELICGRRR